MKSPRSPSAALEQAAGAIVLRTQGGLGSQLFQVLYGRLLAQKLDLPLHEVHESPHRPEHSRQPPPAIHPPPSRSQLRVSSWRIPQMLRMVLGRGFERPLRLGHDWYVDGQFQMGKHYQQFVDQALREQLQKLAAELDLARASLDQCLVDLRLNHFFGNRNAARLNALTRLSACPEGATLMTNDEAMLREDGLSALMTGRRAQLISTQDLSPLEVLRTMARYKRLETTNSTLAVWCHLLSGTQVSFQEPRLAELTNHLSAFAPWR